MHPIFFSRFLLEINIQDLKHQNLKFFDGVKGVHPGCTLERNDFYHRILVPLGRSEFRSTRPTSGMIFLDFSVNFTLYMREIKVLDVRNIKYV